MAAWHMSAAGFLDPANTVVEHPSERGQHLEGSVTIRGRMRLLPVFVLALVLAGCQVGGPDSREPLRPSSAQNTEEMARVVEQARALESVIDVRGVYDTSFTTYGSTNLIATVEAGTPPARTKAVADELIALMWRSRIDPINTMGSRVVPPGGDPSRGSLAGRSIDMGAPSRPRTPWTTSPAAMKHPPREVPALACHPRVGDSPAHRHGASSLASGHSCGSLMASPRSRICSTGSRLAVSHDPSATASSTAMPATSAVLVM